MIAYLDLPSGLSGNMFLGCLIDAGWSVEALHRVLAGLPLPPDRYTVRVDRVRRGGLRATLVTVEWGQDEPHRSLSDILEMLDAAHLPPPVKEGARGTFQRLAEAEARVHGVPVEEIHFHEVGALDAIVDIVGVAAGLHDLGIERLYASPVPLGHGWVETAHGPLPLPAPATLELLAAAGAPLRPPPGEGELVTPTGAALLAQYATFEQPAMLLRRVGYGAGHREFAWPNVARLWLGEPLHVGPMVQLETNIDDMNPELYAAVSERLFAAGARDVWLTPIQMKKGRPGVLLSVLAPAEFETTLARILLEETTTLGLRVVPVRRHEAGREMRQVITPFGPVDVKLKLVDGRVVGAAPEYEACARLAREQGVPVRRVYEAALAAAQTFLEDTEETDRTTNRTAKGGAA